jgi:hypothetical protein
MKFYLAHPFDSREIMRKWELKIEKSNNIEIVNPFYDIARKDVDDIDKSRKERYEIDNPQELVERDLYAIHSTQGVIAIIDGSISYGTIMEIYHSFQIGVPVYIICSNGHHDHPWLRYCAKKIFTNLSEFELYLIELLM